MLTCKTTQIHAYTHTHKGIHTNNSLWGFFYDIMSFDSLCFGFFVRELSLNNTYLLDTYEMPNKNLCKKLHFSRILVPLFV